MFWFQPAKRHGFIQTDAKERLRVDEAGFASETTLGDRCRGTRVRFERLSGAPGETVFGRGAADGGAACTSAWAALVGTTEPQSVLKRARERAIREKRAKKHARAGHRLPDEPAGDLDAGTAEAE